MVWTRLSGGFAFAQAGVMAPFRDLLSTTNHQFYWDQTLDDLFTQSKEIIVNKIIAGVKSFEIDRPTCLATDWSKTGIGYFLLQKHCSCRTEDGPNCGNGHWQIILAGSRFTKEAESRYAPVEGEALALIYDLESCRMFVLGCPSLLVAVDHKPLLKIFSDQALENIKNPRLFNFKETIKHVPGSLHTGPDAASRFPASHSKSTQNIDNCRSMMMTNIRDSYMSDTTNTDEPIDAMIADSLAATYKADSYFDHICQIYSGWVPIQPQ